jgi:hypothetical protein
MTSIALSTTKFLVVCVKFLNFIAENLKNIYSTMLSRALGYLRNYPALRETPLKTLSTRYQRQTRKSNQDLHHTPCELCN